MRVSLQVTFCALVCILAALVLPSPGRAQDDTNAALIDGTVWGQMRQVMGGVSFNSPAHADIRGPTGLYAVVIMAGAITMANDAVTEATKHNVTLTVDDALTNYYGLLLDNKAVSGILLIAKWKDLNPSAPATDSTGLHYLDDVLNAIDTWNAAHPGEAPKTLQLDVTPGFNTPDWFFDLPDVHSCNHLFVTGARAPASSCAYTHIFQETESGTPTYKRLPLPWNPTYKRQWRDFLVALNSHIYGKPSYVSDFVSIGVAGPTASSVEIILPNGRGTNNPGQLSLPGVSNAKSVTALEAWDALLANAYGAGSSYVDSDRAFVEEWAAAIDMYGEVFSGVTLVVVTGAGLPDFVQSSSMSALLDPPPGFADDCGNRPSQDCAAEAAILAYFAEPSVGGANAKATAEDGLKATGINGTPLSGASVKWLSQQTSATLNVLPGTVPVVSRLLGGLQVAKVISQNVTLEGCPTGNACSTIPLPPPLGPGGPRMAGCLLGPPLAAICVAPLSSEGALLNVLAAFFAGTSVAGVYGDSPLYNGGSGGALVMNAPINYLQIYDRDILYAGGLAGCSDFQLMRANSKLSCRDDMSAKTVLLPSLAKNMTAQDLLELASQQIFASTAEPITLPPAGCCRFFVPRNAFQGDNVCVSATEQTQAATDNAAAKSHYKSGYDFTDDGIHYGSCVPGYVWRRASMGDYVCVTRAQHDQVGRDNAAFASRFGSGCPPAPRPHCGPQPNGSNSCN